jgi:hypothetical protein
MVAKPGLKVICPVYCPALSPARDALTLMVALPLTSIEPLAGFALSQDASEAADQGPAPHPLPFWMVTV